MNETINNQTSSEFSSGYLRWLYSLTIVALMFVFIIQPKLKKVFPENPNVFMPAHVIAGGQIVGHGIEEFRTGTIEPIPTKARTAALIYLLLFLVLAPTIVIFYIRRPVIETSPQEKKFGVMNTLQTFFFIIGLCLTSFAIIATVGGSYISPAVFTTMKNDNAISEERDMLTNDLVDAYIQVVQYYYQSEQFGGKKKNIFQKNSDGSFTSAVTLTDYGVSEKKKFGTLYLEPISSDTMITVHAIGNSVVENSKYKNINDEIGKIEYIVNIVPAAPSYNIHKIN